MEVKGGIMNIRPLYDRIVVKRIEEQETTVEPVSELTLGESRGPAEFAAGHGAINRITPSGPRCQHNILNPAGAGAIIAR
jgi:hypothetical protein